MGDAHHEAKRLRWLFEAIVEHVPVMIFVKEATELRWELWNRAGEELVGIPRDKLQGRTDHEFFPKEQADFFVARDREVLDGRKLVTVEEPIDTPHGRRVLLTRKVPILDDEGQPWFLLGVSLDITERKAHEDEMLRTNARMRETLEQLVALQGLAETGQLAGDAAREATEALDAGDAAGARAAISRIAELAASAEPAAAVGARGQCALGEAVRAAAEGLASVTVRADATVKGSADDVQRAVRAALEELGAHRSPGAAVEVGVEPDGVAYVDAWHPSWRPSPAERPGMVRSRAGLALAEQLLARSGGAVWVTAGEGGLAHVRALVPVETSSGV